MRLIHDLMKHPKTTFEIAAHQKLHGVSYLTARADLEGLAGDGILKKSKKGVKSVFAAGKNFAGLAAPQD
jgi:DeoR/GlpR family transcriptional regulator of sugar metabolism